MFEARPKTYIGAAAAAVVVALTTVAIRHLREEPPPPPPPLHLAIAPPAGSELGAGDDSLDAAISPDESQLAFVATTGGTARLWRRTLASGATEVLPGTEGARLPAWKHTGRVVSFFSTGKLRQIALADGRVADLADVESPGGATWMPDGSLLFASGARGPIRRMIDGAVSDATALSPGDRGHAFPVHAGEPGRFTYVAFREDGRRTVRLVAATGERDLTETTGHAQLIGNVLVYARGGVLLAQPFDRETGRLIGRSTPMAPAVGVSPAGHGMFAASARLLLFADAPPRAYDIGWADPSSARIERFAEPADYWQVRLSPDDARAAVTTTAPLLRTLDVFVQPTAGGAPRRLTRAVAADTDPVWSPDGTAVLFRSMQSGRPALRTRALGDPDAPEEPLPGAEPGDTATDWRGRTILVHTPGAGTSGSDIRRIDTLAGAREPVTTDAFDETDARWSPDGRWIAFVSDESGQPDVYAARADGAGERVRVTRAGGSKPRWSRDGRAIFLLRGSRIMRADFSATGAAASATPVTVFDAPGIRDFDVAHRADRFAVLVPAPDGRAPVTRAIVDWRSLVAGGLQASE